MLLGGPDARLGFDAAGHQWGLLDDPPAEVSVLVPTTRQLRSRECWTFPRERPGVRSPRSPGAPPSTTLPDTVVDLCATADDEAVLDLITRAVQGRQASAAELLRCVQGRRRLAGKQLMLAVLAEVGEGSESPLELRYVRDVERAHELPTGSRQHRSRQRRDVRDVLYEQYATIVELDGGTHRLRQPRDMRRDNAALLDGQVSLRYGWPDVAGDPCRVAWQVGAVLADRGWTGLPARCPRCVGATEGDLRFG